MPSKKMAEAMRLGDGFHRKTFGSGIKFKAKLLLAINVILVILVIQDEARDILTYDTGFQRIISTSIIVLALILGFIGYKLTRDLDEWEEMYKRVKKILS
jgi:hypothetical protein